MKEETTSRARMMEYEIRRASGPVSAEGGWDDEPWRAVEPLELAFHMGEPPAHRPRTQAKILYHDKDLFLRFRVEDRYVLATAQNHQDQVCIDSCVEFFFTPGEDLSQGYFNIETNCGGTMLFHHQQARGVDQRDVDPAVIESMEIHASMPRFVQPEHTEPVTWTLGYRIPTAALQAYAPVTFPAPGVRWRANLYKCADLCSHPHWLTWSEVDNPQPDFHLKEFFGFLRFGA